MKLVSSFTDLNVIIEINKDSLCPNKTELFSSSAFCDLEESRKALLLKGKEVILSGY